MGIEENRSTIASSANPAVAGLRTARAFYDALATTPLGRTTLIGFLIVAALVPLNLLQHKFLGWSVLAPLKDWLLHFGFDNSDSWNPMRQALDYVRANSPSTLYQEIFFNQHVKFQYAPTALLPIMGLQALGFDTTNAFLNNINRIFIAANAVGLGILFRLVLTRVSGPAAASSQAGIAGAILAGVASFLFYPMMMAFWTGQIQIWIDAAFTFACIAVLTNRKLTAGILIGLVCLLKPQFSVFALWALFRKEWRFIAGAAAVLVPCGLLSLAIFGLQAHLDYLRVLSFLSQRGEAMIANNSVNGILNDWLGTANPLIWDERGFPPYNPYVHVGGLIAAILLIGGSLLVRMERPGMNGLLSFQAAALAYTMAAPIAWEHHYGILPPVLVSLFCVFAAAPLNSVRRPRLIAFCAVYLLSAICITSNKYAIATPLNWFHGYLFAAGLGVIYLLWLAARDGKVEAQS